MGNVNAGWIGNAAAVLARIGADPGDDEERLRRFMGTVSGRKAQYPRLLVDALDLTRVPRPLDRALAHV